LCHDDSTINIVPCIIIIIIILLGSIKNIHLYIFRNLNFVFSVLICRSSVFCILALGSGQCLLYRLGSGLGLVLVLVLRFCFVLTAVEVYILNVSLIIISNTVYCF